MFGTSPVLRILFKSSKNPSLTIWVSENKNVTG